MPSPRIVAASYNRGRVSNPSKYQVQAVVQDQEYGNDDAGKLEDRNLVSRCGHARQAARRTLHLRRHGRKRLGLR